MSLSLRSRFPRLAQGLVAPAALATVLSTGAAAQESLWCINLEGSLTGSSAIGVGTVRYDVATATLSWDVSYGPLNGPQTNAHFHGPAMPGGNAGVTVPMGVGNPLVGSAVISDAQAAELLSGLWYINIHSMGHPGGEIRDHVDHECFTLLCSALPNSTGNGATLTTEGDLLVATDDFSLSVTDMPPAQFAFMLIGNGTGVFMPPGSAGNICLGGASIGRFNRPGEIQLSNAAGEVGFAPAISNLPTPPGGAVMSGQSWNFQAWFRDTPNTSNFTDAITVRFR